MGPAHWPLVPRQSAFGRLLHHFHTHPKGRLHEFLFWTGLGALLGATSWLAYWRDLLSLPLALIAWIVAACLVGWAFLPQRKGPAPPPPPGRRRAEIAKAVQASKKERKRQPPRR